MKSFLQNLLIAISLMLCALIAYQWLREARTHEQLQKRTNELHAKAEAVQSLEGQLKRSEAEVMRLETLKADLTEIVKTNRQEIARLDRELEQAKDDHERDVRQIEAYKDAVDRANEAIKKQNEDIAKQNEEMNKLVADRNELVQKHNKLAEDYNKLAKQWNDQQQELAKQAEEAAGKGSKQSDQPRK